MVEEFTKTYLFLSQNTVFEKSFFEDTWNAMNKKLDEPKRFYPLSGLSKTLTVGSAESGEYIVYKSDRYGFYNPDEEWNDKVKIVVIGDSNVHSTSTKWENSSIRKEKWPSL